MFVGGVDRRDDQERTGGDLLFRGLSRSTIGAKKFHVRVRNGIGWDLLAIATRSFMFLRSCLRKLKEMRVVLRLHIRIVFEDKSSK